MFQVKTITIRPNDHLQTKEDIAMLYQVHMELLRSINFSIKKNRLKGATENILVHQYVYLLVTHLSYRLQK